MNELSPLFQEIEFHERFRGYDPDEVDAYVDRVAKAAALAQGRLAELHERAEAAEARLAAGGASETEETLRRTLVLAQRTADAAVEEAREEAARLVSEAEGRAQSTITTAESRAEAQLRDAEDRSTGMLAEAEERSTGMLAEAEERSTGMVAEAEERSTRMVAEAEAERRTLIEEAEAAAASAAAVVRDRLASEVEDLARTRDFLQDDIDILERHLGEQRARLVSSVATLSDLLEAPDSLQVAPAPATSGVQPPPVAGHRAPEADDAASETLVAGSDEVVPAGAGPGEVVLAGAGSDEVVPAGAGSDEVVPAGAGPDEVVPAGAGPAPSGYHDEEPVPAEVSSEEVGAPGATAEPDERREPADDQPRWAPLEPATDEHAPSPQTPGAEVVELGSAEEPGAPEVAPVAAHPAGSAGTIGDEIYDELIDEQRYEEPEPRHEPSSAASTAGFDPDAGDEVIDLVAAEREAQQEREAAEEASGAAGPGQPSPPVLRTAADLDAGPRLTSEATDAGPATMPVPVMEEAPLFAEGQSDDDPFLSQLRDAVATGEPENDNADDDADALSAFFDQDDDENGRSWFGRRR